MNSQEIADLTRMFNQDANIIFIDDFIQGNIVEIEEEFATYIDFLTEEEVTINLEEYSLAYFEIDA